MKPLVSTRNGALIAGLSALIAASGALSAEDESSKRLQIEEVIVTAQKRSESKQDVPMSIQVTTAEMLASYQISDMKDIAKLSPGLDFGNSRNAISAVIKMRGVGQDGVAGLTGAAVVTFEDGLAQLDVASSIGTLLDVERVEVLRGPQGTLYGQNAPAGVINVFTKRPDFKGVHGSLEFNRASFEFNELKASLNIPLIDEVLAMRLAVFGSESESDIDNEFLNKSAEADARTGARLKLMWLPRDNLDVLIRYTYTDQVNYGNPFFLDGPEPLNNNEDSVALIGIIPDFDIFDRKHFSDISGQSTNLQESGAVSLEWEVGPMIVSSYSQYQRTDRTNVQDNASSPQRDFVGHINDTKRVVAQEIKIANATPQTWEYVAGVFFRKDHANNFSPITLSGNIEGMVTVQADTYRKALDFYGNVTWNFSEQWNFSFGLRSTNTYARGIIFSDGAVEASASVVGGAFVPGFPAFADDFTPGLPVNLSSPPDPDPTRDDDAISGSLKIRHFISEDKMAYLAIDSGYRTGGFTVGVSASNNEDWKSLSKYEDETSQSFELGYKSTLFDGTVQFNAAVFYQRFQDFQIGKFPGPAPNKPITAFTATLNAEEAVGKGGELELFWLINEHWDVTAGVAVAEVIAEKFTRDICTPTEPRETDEQSLCDHSGASVNADPKYYATFSTQYRTPMNWADADFIARALISGKSSRDLITSTPRLEELSEAYYTMDVNIGLRQFDNRWSATLWVKNILDEEYLVATPGLNTDGDGGFIARGRAGAGRTIGFSIAMNFGAD